MPRRSDQVARRYLNLIPFDEALSRLKDAAPSPDRVETVLLDKAAGRVTAEAIYTKYSVPGASVAAMDGLAVRSRDTARASDQCPLEIPDFELVNTGQVIPPSYDAIVMVEDVWKDGDKFLIRKSAAPRQHVRPPGEDIMKGDLVLPRRHLVRVFDIGALASYGIAWIKAVSVRVGIISTGSELVPLGVPPSPGQSVESNSLFAEAYLSRMGATCRRYPVVPDDPVRIAEILRKSVAENDLVLLSAGSSAGTTDFAEHLLSSRGELIFHGVSIKPGKPVMLGIMDGTPVLGMPGYPVAAQTVIREFAARLLLQWGLSPVPTFHARARIAHDLSSELGYDEFVSVTVGRVNDTLWAVPQSRGFGVQMAVVRSNGYLHVPASMEGVESLQEVDVDLFSDPRLLNQALLMVGSREPPIHLLADMLVDRGITLQVCHNGNMGGILALRSGSCHAAPLCLPRIDQWDCRGFFKPLQGMDMVRMTLAEREVGLCSREGMEIDDLRTSTIINRPRGTSSRLLLDELLSRHTIRPEDLAGYNQEVKSQEGVIAAILDGSADAGITIGTAAAEQDLSFFPLAHESYELAIPKENLDDRRISEVISILRSSRFSEKLAAAGEYDTARTGQIIDLSSDTTVMRAPRREGNRVRQ